VKNKRHFFIKSFIKGDKTQLLPISGRAPYLMGQEPIWKRQAFSLANQFHAYHTKQQ
jgi:hypothetical protein